MNINRIKLNSNAIYTLSFKKYNSFFQLLLNVFFKGLYRIELMNIFIEPFQTFKMWRGFNDSIPPNPRITRSSSHQGDIRDQHHHATNPLINYFKLYAAEKFTIKSLQRSKFPTNSELLIKLDTAEVHQRPPDLLDEEKRKLLLQFQEIFNFLQKEAT
jgi:hypothetical protein